MATLQHPPAEYMDVDPESVGRAPQEHLPSAATSLPSSDASEPVRPAVTPDHPSSAALLSDDAALASSTDQGSSAELARSTTRPDQELGSGLPSTAAGSNSFSPYERLLNPRGGTSISSSLLPIRPDSDDDDDMDLDHDQPVSSSASAHTRLPRTRRYPGPELVADLIHHQLLQSLQESVGVTEEEQQQQQHQQHQHEPPQQQGDDGSQSRTDNARHDVMAGTASSADAQALRPLAHDASDPSITGLRQRHQRTASMDSLDPLGPRRRNDTPGAAAAADPSETSTSTSTGTGTGPSTEASTETDAEASGSFMDRTQFLMNQLPFFMRLLTDLSRGIRLPDEAGGEDAENRPGAVQPEAASATDPATLTAAAADTPATTEADSPSTASLDSLEGRREGTSEAQTDTNTQPRRRNATIRFVQIGGGLGHALRNRSRVPGPNNETGEMSGAGEGGEAGENTNSESEGRGPGAASEDLGEAIILFLSGPTSEPQSESDPADSTQDGSDDTTGARPRQRSPWIVLSLSGGCKFRP